MQNTTQTQRNISIDAIKVIASFGVVAIHVHNDTHAADNIGRLFLNFCVPFFYVTALSYFVLSLKSNRSIFRSLSKMGKRIVLPFLIWSIIYLALLLIKDMITGGARPFNPWQIFLYGSSAEHLYYLPQLITMQVIIIGAFLLVGNAMQNMALALLIAAMCYLSWGWWSGYYGVTSAASITMYLVAAFYFAPRLANIQKSNWYYALGLALIALSLSSLRVHYTGITNDYLIRLPLGGIGILLIAINLPNVINRNWLVNLGSVTYGIYLSHVVFLECFEFLVEKGHFNIYYDAVNKLIVAMLIFALSVAFTLTVRRVPVLRLLLIGEEKK